MRVEEITESGIFKFITKDGSSSDFLGWRKRKNYSLYG